MRHDANRKENVGLVLNYDSANALQILAGFQSFRDWSVDFTLKPLRASREHLIQVKDQRFDHLLVFGEGEAWEVFHAGLHENADHVYLAGVTPYPVEEGVPPFTLLASIDTFEVGRMFARHVHDAGYRGIGAHLWYGVGTFEGVVEILDETDATEDPFVETEAFLWNPDWPHPADRSVWSTKREQLRSYIQARHKPIGLLIQTPADALDAVDICGELDLHIPDDVGIVAFGFPREMCHLSRVLLTNIEIPWDQLGRAATGQLNRILNGGPPPDRPALVPPVDLRVRGSSRPQLSEDPRVRRALACIHRRAVRGLDVEAVCREAGACQSLLSTLIKQQTGKTIGELIRDEQLLEACDLLEHTNMTLADIAARSGLGRTDNLINNFKRRYHTTPGAYREQKRR